MATRILKETDGLYDIFSKTYPVYIPPTPEDIKPYTDTISDISRQFDDLSKPKYINATADERYFQAICHDADCTTYHYGKMGEQIAKNTFIGFPESERKFFTDQSDKGIIRQRMIFHKYALRDYIHFKESGLPNRDYDEINTITIFGFIHVQFYNDEKPPIDAKNKNEHESRQQIQTYLQKINKPSFLHNKDTFRTEVKDRMREEIDSRLRIGKKIHK